MTAFTVSIAVAKQMPCAPGMIAVLTPITAPRESTSGPPELPGLSAASVCSTSSISRPLCARRLRPSALTTPVVTVCWKPYGLPIAIASCPTRTSREEPSTAAGVTAPPRRITAISVSGSSPTRSASRLEPSENVARMPRAPCTTWLLVRRSPSGVNAKPEPLPRRRLNVTSRCATADATASTAPTTAAEYASSRRPSSGAGRAPAAPCSLSSRRNWGTGSKIAAALISAGRWAALQPPLSWVFVERRRACRQPHPRVPAAIVDRPFRRGKARVGKGADRHAHRLVVTLFGVKHGRPANRAEPESELRSVVPDTHVFGGGAEDLERRSEARERREHTAGPALAGEAVADADAY